MNGKIPYSGHYSAIPFMGLFMSLIERGPDPESLRYTLRCRRFRPHKISDVSNEWLQTYLNISYYFSQGKNRPIPVPI